jgi:G3E family GTPase
LRAGAYEPLQPGGSLLAPSAAHRHDARVRSFALVYDAPVSGSRLWQGLEALIDGHGEKLLRIKGIVNVEGAAGPKVLHIVQHVLYPVQALPGWPDEDRRTRLVFIVRDLEPALVRRIIDDALAQPG